MWWTWFLIILGLLIAIGVAIVYQRRVHAQHRVRDAMRDEPDRRMGGPPQPIAH